MASGPGRRRWLAPLLLVVLALAPGCHAEVDLLVDVGEGGDGVVRVGVGLDEEAARSVPDLDRQLWLEDLRAGGWEIAGPALEADGRTWVRARRPFRTVEEATLVLDQVSGPDGPFGALRVQRSTGRLVDRTRLTGPVDLTAGLAAFTDEALREELGAASPLSDAALEERLGRPAAEAVGVRVTAVLPGDVRAEAGAEEAAGAASWRLAPGDRVVVDATGTRLRGAALARAAVAALAIAALVVVLVVRRRSRRGQTSTDQALGSTV